jgi:hypothetical protein
MCLTVGVLEKKKDERVSHKPTADDVSFDVVAASSNGQEASAQKGHHKPKQVERVAELPRSGPSTCSISQTIFLLP